MFLYALKDCITNSLFHQCQLTYSGVVKMNNASEIHLRYTSGGGRAFILHKDTKKGRCHNDAEAVQLITIC